MKSVSIYYINEGVNSLDSYAVKVGENFFAIGVRRKSGPHTSELNRWLEKYKGFVEVVKLFPETPNFNYYDNIEQHSLQPAILKRIK